MRVWEKPISEGFLPFLIIFQFMCKKRKFPNNDLLCEFSYIQCVSISINKFIEDFEVFKTEKSLFHNKDIHIEN